MTKRRNWYEQKVDSTLQFSMMRCWVHGYQYIGR